MSVRLLDIGVFRKNILQQARLQGYTQNNPVTLQVTSRGYSKGEESVYTRTILVSFLESTTPYLGLIWICTDPTLPEYKKVVQYTDGTPLKKTVVLDDWYLFDEGGSSGGSIDSSLLATEATLRRTQASLDQLHLDLGINNTKSSETTAAVTEAKNAMIAALAPLNVSATESTLQSIKDSIDSVKSAQGVYSSYLAQQVDESVPGTTYIRKAGAKTADPWLIQRVVENGTDTTIAFAGIRNNPTITSATAAWTARSSLSYSDITTA